jgi:hypothetical protein
MTGMVNDLPSFERAEYGAGSGVCAEQCVRCRQRFTDRFFLLNGQPLCELCANAAVLAPAEGGDAAFLKAILVGLVAAVVGCVVYAVVEVLTGWTIGYVALAVGWLVGKGMKLASEGRGGRRYQVVAAGLTYCSVSFANLLVILHALRGRQIVVGERFVMLAAKYGLMSPFVDLRTGVSGIIGLFILFIGIRAAWALTAGSEYRITGPHEVTGVQAELS